MNIIAALNEFYHHYNKHRYPPLPPLGFQMHPLHFVIVLNAEGHFMQLKDVRKTHQPAKGKAKIVPDLFLLPLEETRTSGVKPYLMFDNLEYLLGCTQEGVQQGKVAKRHQAFVERLTGLPDQVKADQGVAAVLKFYQQPTEREKVLQSELWTECAEQKGWLSFQLQGDPYRTVVERPQLKAYVSSAASTGEQHRGFCPFSGASDQPLARLHGKLKLPDLPVLVSYNFKSACFYGREQGENCPISQLAADRYVKALNHLLGSEQHHWKLDDTWVVFWSSEPCAFEEQFADLGAFIVDDQTDPRKTAGINQLYRSVFGGQESAQDSSRAFYLLSFSPNRGRVAVKFQHKIKLDQLKIHLAHYFRDLELVSPRPMFPGLKNLLSSCRSPRKDGKVARENSDDGPGKAQSRSPRKDGKVARENSDDGPGKAQSRSPGKDGQVASVHTNDLLRSALLGYPFPAALKQQALQRLYREEDSFAKNYFRIAILKACLRRQQRKEEITVALNKESVDPAYLLGRMFAIVEHLQRHVLGKKGNLRRRYFKSCATRPQRIFRPLLDRADYYYQQLLRSGGKEGAAVYLSRLLQEVVSQLDEVPEHHTSDAQCRFVLGHYHQRHDLFSKKEEQKDA